ncbi:MAG: hypothetical protein K0S16_800 [Moraxellaceae bacterium]|nr:hypothetical protein [Moraxellaceae bacterium]
MNLRHSPLAAAVLAALSTSAKAETPAAEAPAAALPTVTVTGSAVEEDRSYTPAAVTGRLNADLRDVPQSATVINKAVLNDQAATSLVEALRNVPGITLSAGEGGNIGDSINLRGFSARTDLFLDGFRDRGQYSRDVFALEAVEVLKGPASMLFGRGSTGGVINQVSKRPGLKDKSEISVSVGTDDYYRTTFDTNKKLSETSAARVAAFWQDIGFERDQIEKESFGVAPSIRFGIGTPTEITLSALAQRNREVPDYGGPVLPARTGGVAQPVDIGNRFYGYSTDHFDQDIDVVTLGIRHKLTDKVTLRNQTQFSQVKTNAQPTPLGSVTVVSTGSCSSFTSMGAVSTVPLNCLQAPRQDRDRDVTDTALFNLTDITARFGEGAVKHTLIAGLEVGQDKYRFVRHVWPTASTTTLDAPVNGPRPGTPVRGQTTDTEAFTAAVFINDQIDLGEQWKFVAGLRFDHFEADSYNQNFTLPAPYTSLTALAPAMSSTDEMLSTRAGLIFQPTPAQSYYISYGTSFNPSAEAVTQSSGSVSLEPEENRSYELGGKWSLAEEAVVVNAAVFRVEKTNARTGPSAAQTLDGNIRVDGFETSIMGQVTPDWQIIGGYTFLNSEVLESRDVGTGISAGRISKGRDYQNTPRHSATLWNTYRLTPEWQVGAGAVGSSDRFVNNFESAETDGYVRMDAMLAFLQPSYDVRLNVQNLNDERYYEVASQGRATQAMGTRWILTGTWRF